MTIKRRQPLNERLKQGLEEGIAHVQGELTLRTAEVSEVPPEIDGERCSANSGGKVNSLPKTAHYGESETC